VPKPSASGLNLPGKDFPTIGALAPEMPNGVHQVAQLDLPTTGPNSSRASWSAAALPRHAAVGIDPNIRLRRKGGVKDDPLAPVSTLRRGRRARTWTSTSWQAGSKIFIPVSSRRPDLDRRFALPPGATAR